MKIYFYIFFALLCLFVGAGPLWGAPGVAGQSTPAQLKEPPASTPYAVTTRDANSRVWERTDYELDPSGQAVPRKHSYTELATGMHYLKNGKWLESDEIIDILPDGTASATRGQHQANFPGDIYQGQIELVTPDGQHLRSRPLGLSYFDGKNSVLIAELTNSVGIVVGSNQVIYPNAFTDIKADLRYTYTKAGFEQDIILHQQPPTPESFDLDPDNARFEVLTEFFSPPQPVIKSSKLAKQAGLALDDQSLEFGQMQMVPGRAFLLGNDAADIGAQVSKQWLLMDGRRFLVEEVPVDAIADGLAKLPLTAMNSGSAKTLHTAAKHRVLPRQRLAGNNASKTMMLAKAEYPVQGFVLDYQTINSSQTNYTFQGDTTYLISDSFYAYGTTTVEGGTVIKSISDHYNWLVCDQVAFKTDPYRMAVFTSMNDNSVGESITGSTGTPSQNDFGCTLSLYYVTEPVRYARFLHAAGPIAVQVGPTTIQNCQFVDCGLAIYAFDTGGSVTLQNCLFSQCFSVADASSGAAVGVNLTVDQCDTVIRNDYAYGAGPPAYMTNCLFTDVTNVLAGTYITDPVLVMQNCVVTNRTGVYQPRGAGNYYLATNSPYRNAGTTNIGPALLASLAQKTTYPPIVYTNVTFTTATTFSPQAQRDTDTPDLGYHYDPIDYLVNYCWITNATLTINSGTAIASYDQGIIATDGSTINSIGIPQSPNWFVRNSSVQEQSGLPGANVAGALSVNPWHVNTPPNGQFRFTKFACPAGGGMHLYNGQPGSPGWSYNNLWIQNCEFYGGANNFSGGSNSVTTLVNNLFARSAVTANPSGFAYTNDTLAISNNLFWNAQVTLLSHAFSNQWSVFNNDFDGGTNKTTAIGGQQFAINGYNAYLNCNGRIYPTNAYDVVSSNALAYQVGPLGGFYQPTNSPLINVGSTNANLLGLYHYTTLTNQVKEANSIVDIGYHYLAVDGNGVPIDSNGNGIPDFVEDANGNGIFDAGDLGEWDISPFGLGGQNQLQVFTPLK